MSWWNKKIKINRTSIFYVVRVLLLPLTRIFVDMLSCYVTTGRTQIMFNLRAYSFFNKTSSKIFFDKVVRIC